MANDTNAPDNNQLIPLDEVMEQIFEEQPDIKRKIDKKLERSPKDTNFENKLDIEGP